MYTEACKCLKHIQIPNMAKIVKIAQEWPKSREFPKTTQVAKNCQNLQNRPIYPKIGQNLINDPKSAKIAKSDKISQMELGKRFLGCHLILISKIVLSLGWLSIISSLECLDKYQKNNNKKLFPFSNGNKCPAAQDDNRFV